MAGFKLPGYVSASVRYWTEDIIEPKVSVTSNSTISAPTGAGIGFDVKVDLIEKPAIRNDEIPFNH